MMNNQNLTTGDNWRQLAEAVCFKVRYFRQFASSASPYKGRQTGVAETDPGVLIRDPGLRCCLHAKAGFNISAPTPTPGSEHRAGASDRQEAHLGHVLATTAADGASGYQNRSRTSPKAFDINDLSHSAGLTSASRQHDRAESRLFCRYAERGLVSAGVCAMGCVRWGAGGGSPWKSSPRTRWGRKPGSAALALTLSAHHFRLSSGSRKEKFPESIPEKPSAAVMSPEINRG
jgi:hypothetical protein